MERVLNEANLPVFIDRHVTLGWRWADAISRRIEKAIAVIPLLSAHSMCSDMMADELRLARKTAQSNGGRPRILPVRVRLEGPCRRRLMSSTRFSTRSGEGRRTTSAWSKK